jgi:hypothetical protein
MRAIDEEIDRVEPSKAMNLVKAYFGYLVGRIVGMDAMKQPFGFASDVVTGRTEIVPGTVSVGAYEISGVAVCDEHSTHVFISQADADVFL